MIIQFPQKSRKKKHEQSKEFTTDVELEKHLDAVNKTSDENNNESLAEDFLGKKLGAPLTKNQSQSLVEKMSYFYLSSKDIKHLYLADRFIVGSDSLDIKADKRNYITGLFIVFLVGCTLVLLTILTVIYPDVARLSTATAVVWAILAIVYLALVRWYYVQPWWIVRRGISLAREC